MSSQNEKNSVLIEREWESYWEEKRDGVFLDWWFFGQNSVFSDVSFFIEYAAYKHAPSLAAEKWQHGSLWNTDWILLQVIDLFRFLFFPGSVLEGCTFLEIPFRLGCPVCCHVIIHDIIIIRISVVFIIIPLLFHFSFIW